MGQDLRIRLVAKPHEEAAGPGIGNRRALAER